MDVGELAEGEMRRTGRGEKKREEDRGDKGMGGEGGQRKGRGGGDVSVSAAWAQVCKS